MPTYTLGIKAVYGAACLFISYLWQFGEESQGQEEEEGGGALYASVDDEPPLVEEQEQNVYDNTADGQVN